MPPGAGDLGVVPNLKNLTVRHVLCRIIGGTRLGHLDGTSRPTSSEEGMRAGIADLGAIDVQVVVVETRHQWIGGAMQNPSGSLTMSRSVPPEIRFDFCGVGSFDTDLHPSRAVNAGIFRSPNICLRR